MSDYQPGVCNIGPQEIAVRRRSGDVGVLASLGLITLLIATKAPRWSRLAVALPAAVAAGGYLQARAHFCAGLGSRGRYNFGPVGQTQEVTEAEDRARDTRTSRRIQGQSLVIGLAVAAAAFALPER